MSRIQRQGTECGRPQEAWLLGPLVALGTYLHRPARLCQEPRAQLCSPRFAYCSDQAHTVVISRGRLAKTNGWPSPGPNLLHWKANPVNPLDRSSG